MDKVQFKNLVIAVRTVDEKYCAVTCPHMFEPIAKRSRCFVFAHHGTELEFDEKIGLNKRLKACMMKEIKPKKGK